MKYLRILIPLILLIALLLPMSVYATSLYEYYNTNDDNYDSIYGTSWQGQTFTTTDGYTITSVKVKIGYRDANPSGTITLSIKETDTDLPTGDDLVYGTIDASTVTDAYTAAAWYTFDFGAGYALSATTKYAIVLRQTNDVSHRIAWRADYTSPSYADGAWCNSDNGGSTWTTDTAKDFMFENYGDAASTTSPTVQTDAATSVSYNTTTLNGNITDFGTATNATVTFEYGETTGYGDTATADESPVSGTGTVHADISGLDAGTTYHFRLKVDADDTDPVYGDDAQFTTLIQEPTVTTDAADYTSPGNATATLNGTLDDLGDDSAVDCSFEWGYDTGYGNTTTPEELTEAGTFDAAISGFLRNVTVHFRAVAENAYGTSYGDDETFTIASGELAQVGYYAPNDIISGTTLPDRDTSDGIQNGVITWGTNLVDVDIGPAEPIGGDTPTPTEPIPTFYPGTPTPPGGTLYPTDCAPTFPLASYITTMLDAGGIPRCFFWHFLAYISAIAAGVAVYGLIALRAGTTSTGLLVQALVSGTVIGFWWAVGVVPWWSIAVFGVESLAVVMAKQAFSW